jgi:hypothetical protein
VEEHLDPWASLDPIDQVARHAGAELAAADQQPNGLRGLGEGERGLPGRVASSHHDHRVVAAALHLQLGGGVVHARALEVLESGYGQFAVTGTRRDQDRPGEDHGAVLEPDGVLAVVLLERGRSAGTSMWAPNFSAWITARSASSGPEIPDGKPR